MSYEWVVAEINRGNCWHGLQEWRQWRSQSVVLEISVSSCPTRERERESACLHWRGKLDDWRTSQQDSRESQSMMEWCHSVDCWKSTCSIISSSPSPSSNIEWVSLVIAFLVLLVMTGEWMVVCHWIERTSTQGSRESQPMMEWCHSVDCCSATCSSSSNQTSFECVSIVIYSACCWSWLIVNVIGLTYRDSRFTREPTDDGMVPFNWL